MNSRALPTVVPIPGVFVRCAPLAGPQERLRREERLERGRAGADDGDVNLDDGPEVHQDALLERVCGKCVRVDRVQPDDGHDGGEGADAEDG